MLSRFIFAFFIQSAAGRPSRRFLDRALSCRVGLRRASQAACLASSESCRGKGLLGCGVRRTLRGRSGGGGCEARQRLCTYRSISPPRALEHPSSRLWASAGLSSPTECYFCIVHTTMGILDLKIILHLSVIIKVSFTKAQQDKNCLSKRLTGDFNQKTSNLKSQWLPLGGSNGLLAKASASVVGAADTRSFEHRPGHRTPKYPLGNSSVTVRDRLLLFKAPLKFSFAFALVTW